MVFILVGQFSQILESLLMLRCECTLLERINFIIEPEFLTEPVHAIKQIHLRDTGKRIVDLGIDILTVTPQMARLSLSILNKHGAGLEVVLVADFRHDDGRDKSGSHWGCGEEYILLIGETRRWEIRGALASNKAAPRVSSA